MAAILAFIIDDVTVLQQRHNPKYLAYLVEHLTDYLSEVESFRNIETLQKPKGAGLQPPLLPARLGLNLRLSPGVEQIQRLFLTLSDR